MSKPIPKSLHTVTVLVRVAQLHQRFDAVGGTPEKALASALYTLGYSTLPANDPYGLAAAALKQLNKES